ncbi:cellulose synthase/poly-beta-1,6-N-acetylglucosamine synthase-like glycosyltransferase [Bradyrhizobium sp. LB7.1]
MSLLATISTAAVASYALLSSVHKSAQALYALRTDASLPPYDLVDTAALPSVDVIVPCFNEDPRTLAACLKSLASQDYPGRLQLYVVDDGLCKCRCSGPGPWELRA